MKFMILVKSNPDLEARLAAMSEAAVAWVKRCPNPMPVPSEIEIRPIGWPRTGAVSARPDAMRCRVSEDVRSMEGLGACFSKRAGEQNPAVMRPVRGLRALTGTKTRPTHDRGGSLTPNTTRA